MGAVGHKMLSFLDAYLDYNQIRMDLTDEDKIAFISKLADCCYKVMLFELKNVGATYQWLMDKIFDVKLRRNLEVYVNDIVAKFDNLSAYIKDLEKVFGKLWKHNMRLNPDKCVFGAKGGKFLGFMLTRRGIHANPNKCQVILDMRSPRNIKETQMLAGRISTLFRFLPRIVERAK